MTAYDTSTPKHALTYKDAGVDIDAGNALIDDIKHIAKATHRPEVMGSIGGFGALCEIPQGYQNPVLVSGTDGVGTKLKLAMMLNRHNDIGIDLVAMCVNDILVTGAEPLYFLDYYATGKLEAAMAKAVIAGIGRGCEQAGCALVGGETAEMPGMYQAGDYDLAGFCVGVVEKNRIIDGTTIQPGDAIIALASSGPHANGYSLIRHILNQHQPDLQQTLGTVTLADQLMAPTRIYAKALLALHRQQPVRAMAHITGGGLLENIARVLPASTQAQIHTESWQWPDIFTWLQNTGGIASEEMYRTFNCGVGMVIILPEEHAQEALNLLQQHGEQAWVLGQMAPITAQTSAPVVLIP